MAKVGHYGDTGSARFAENTGGNGGGGARPRGAPPDVADAMVIRWEM